MAKNLLDAVYGCLIGGAIGDAMGAPVEGWDYEKIRAIHGKVTDILVSNRGNTGPTYGGTSGESYDEEYDGLPPVRGQFTDDTTLRQLMALAVVQKGGRITPDDYAKVLIEKLNPNRMWVNERVILWKLKAGINPWDCGLGSIPAGVATMAIAPIGIINAGNPQQAYQDAFNIGFVNQAGHNRDGAATFAAGVAEALRPGATIKSILDVMFAHSTYLMKRAMHKTMNLAQRCSSLDEFTEKYYACMLDYSWPNSPHLPNDQDRYFSGNTIELVPITMAILYFTEGEPYQAIIEAASFGRDCDTTAAMAGNICGALHGASSLPAEWIETIEKANLDFYEEITDDPKKNFFWMAEGMVHALSNELGRSKERAQQLETLLNQIH